MNFLLTYKFLLHTMINDTYEVKQANTQVATNPGRQKSRTDFLHTRISNFVISKISNLPKLRVAQSMDSSDHAEIRP